MALYKSKNPALDSKTFKGLAKVGAYEETMTIHGTVTKTALLGLVVFSTAIYTWNLFMENKDVVEIKPYVIGGSIVAFLVALIIIFNKTTAPYLSIVYCGLQGIALGGLSAMFETSFPGIVLQSIILTFSILFVLLLIYSMKIIKVTENFKLIVASATGGIALYYIISLMGGFLGFEVPFIHDNNTGGIIFSVFVVIVASLNLVVDFDFIEEGAKSNAPKYMEWYGAFGLMVTVIWLYLEILRLLAKSRSKK